MPSLRGRCAGDYCTIEIAMTRKLPIFIDAIAKSGATVPFIMPEHIAKTDFVPGSSVAYERSKDYVAIGQFQIRTAYRKQPIGRIEATGAYF